MKFKVITICKKTNRWLDIEYCATEELAEQREEEINKLKGVWALVWKD